MPDNGSPKMSLEEFRRIAYDGEWWQMVDIEEAKVEHARNVEACRKALEYHESKDRPIDVLAVHGSSRSNAKLSCAHELSNSQLLLRSGLDAIRDDPNVKVTELNLREYKIEYCNYCYSSASANCGFPCNCWPFDPMQKLYPPVLRCDVLLLSTGVNQSAMASRLKAFSDRLISMDGGYYVPPEEFVAKDEDWKNRMVAASLNQPVHYDQRLHGRVAAFFISSKDNADDVPVGEGDYYDEAPSYIKVVSDSLYMGYHDYGFYFAEPWLAHFDSVPDEEMSFDKQRLNEDTRTHEQAREAVAAAVELARRFRENPPPPRPHPPNRT